MAAARGFEQIQTVREQVAPGYARGIPIPWWLKLGSKIALSRLPIDYRTWSRLGLFRHSRSGGDRTRLLNGARKYIRSAEQLMGHPPRVALELGPGDSVGQALVAAALGIERTYLIDSGDFARRDLAHYAALAEDLEAAGLDRPDISAVQDRGDLLSCCNAEYLTDGIESFARIDSGCVDLVFSQFVLEHLPYEEFDRFLDESFRVLRTGGLAMHLVDLHDHLGGKLESLRFAHKTWEAPLMRDSGFYTNRLRYPDIVSRCEAAGFETKVSRIMAWPRLPIARDRLDPAFARISDEDLAVCAFDLVLRKPATTT